MTRIENRFADLAGRPAPGSRLHADDLYTAGVRRRRRKRWAVTGAAAVTVAALAIGAAVAIPEADRGAGPAATPSATVPTPSTAPSPSAPPGAAGAYSLEVVDDRHWYAHVSTCGEVGCQRLLGSDDGGKTWTERLPAGSFGPGGRPYKHFFEALAPMILLDRGSPEGETEVVPRLSTDGGRTWRPVEIATAPADRVAAGQYATCAPQTAPAGETPGYPGPCAFGVLDPSTGRLAPLRNQPPMASLQQIHAQPNGMLVATGVTGTAAEISSLETHGVVTASRDGGQTWQNVYEFDCRMESVPYLARIEPGSTWFSEVCPDGTATVIQVDNTTPARTVTVPPVTGEMATHGVFIVVDNLGRPVILDRDGTGRPRRYLVRDGQWRPADDADSLPARPYFFAGPEADGYSGSAESKTKVNEPIDVYRDFWTSPDLKTWTPVTITG